MKIIKIISFLLISAALCGCGGLPKVAAEGEEDFTKQGKEPPRNYPVFLAGDKTSAAFKFNIKYPGKEFNTVLTVNKADGKAFKIKMLGDFATVIIDADFIDGQMQYKYVLGNMFDKKALDVFAKLMEVILMQPDDFIRSSVQPDGQTQINYRNENFLHRYYFKKGLSYPYKMERIKTIVRQKYTFDDYHVYGDTVLPAQVTCEDTHNIVAITLTLISIK